MKIAEVETLMKLYKRGTLEVFNHTVAKSTQTSGTPNSIIEFEEGEYTIGRKLGDPVVIIGAISIPDRNIAAVHGHIPENSIKEALNG